MHYIALIWNEADTERTRLADTLMRDFERRSTDWRTLVDEPGMIVCCQPRSDSRLDEAYVLPDARGVVLGKLFSKLEIEHLDERDEPPYRVVLNAPRGESLVSTRGQALIDDYWGQYVAFLRGPETHHSWVVRDPTGGVPCQRTSFRGIDIYFVRVEDAERLAPLSLSANHHYLAGYLFCSGIAVHATLFNEVETVLPGERVEHLGDTRSRTFVWQAIEHTQHDVLGDEAEAVRLYRRTVRACVHAWASCFDGILHSLSGGLDSSIIAACLADAPTRPRVVCRNYFLDGPNSDERRFARLSARKAGFELIEEPTRTDFPPHSMRVSMRSLIPVAWPLDVDAERTDAERIRSLGLSTEFRGHGGDEIFSRGGSFPTAVDYVWDRGLRRSLLGVALHDAELTRASLYRVLRMVYYFGLRKRRWDLRQTIPANHMSLMSDEVRRAARRDTSYWHPLFREPSRIAPGKFEHAYLLTYGACKAYDPLLPDDAPARLSPLVSQPLMDLSLRTPLYLLRKGGRDRAIARLAFAHDVPREIIMRQSKAYGTHRYRLIIEQNIPIVRELLLDGYLVQHGILDRGRVEEALATRVSRNPAHVVELGDYLTVESWARAWFTVSPAAGRAGKLVEPATPPISVRPVY